MVSLIITHNLRTEDCFQFELKSRLLRKRGLQAILLSGGHCLSKCYHHRRSGFLTARTDTLKKLIQPYLCSSALASNTNLVFAIHASVFIALQEIRHWHLVYLERMVVCPLRNPIKQQVVSRAAHHTVLP